MVSQYWQWCTVLFAVGVVLGAALAALACGTLGFAVGIELGTDVG